MKIERVKLKNFRNYGDVVLEADPKTNLIIGANAQGKTNLIEAVYLCAFAKSFRTHNSSEMINWDSSEAKVSVIAESEEIKKKISIELRKNGKKMIKKDGKQLKRISDLLNNIVIVVFSPDDLKLVKDGPDLRRNFINKEISQLRPKYYNALRRYDDILAEKNKILKEIGLGLSDREYIDMLDVYDEQLAKYGEEIIGYREDFIEMLSEVAGKIQKNISAGKERLEIEYKKSIEKDELFSRIKEDRRKDIYNRYAGSGPHRDDIVFYINGKKANKYGSQGQQRTVVLSLKLAEIKIAAYTLGENPILLLDDVLSELDADRQAFLFSQIDDVQIFITATEVDEGVLGKMGSGKIFEVNEGKVSIKKQ